MEIIAALLGIIGGLAIIAFVFALLFLVLYCVWMWRIFVKMGVAGWKGLIPIYCQYVMAELAWSQIYGFIFIGLFAGGFVLGLIDFFLFSLLSSLLYLAASILSLIILYKVTVGLGKPGWWIILAIFVPFVYFPLMAFTE